MSVITELRGLEILDSRGRPTVQATCRLQSGAIGTASVPSGASTGTAEALELRDGEAGRYGGLGCRTAVAHVNGEIARALCNRPIESHAELDRFLIELDGTPNKARLGANAILAVSLAYARAMSVQAGTPLYAYFAQVLGATMREQSPCLVSEWLGRLGKRLPQATINLFSGGKHAGQQVAIQDVLVVPTHPTSIDESLAMTYAVYYAAARRMQERYGMRLLRADEGGLAPPFESTTAMLDEAVAAIEAAGYRPGQDISLAVDVASSHFYTNGRYEIDGRVLDSDGMIAHLCGWLDRYPIVSIEDGLAEDDWDAWSRLRAAVGTRALVLGDDFLCTNPARIRRAVEARAASALLLKVNQIGTLSEAAQSCVLARDAGWSVTVSARSGETEDNWLADLAVGWAGDHIKIGSITQSERLAKYNRLLEIESEASQRR